MRAVSTTGTAVLDGLVTEPVDAGAFDPIHMSSGRDGIDGGEYANFASIDWIRDFAKDRDRVLQLRHMGGLQGFTARLVDASQAWVLVLVIGIACGVISAWIDVATEWLSDVKFGYCSAGFYLNRRFCCSTSSSHSHCTDWVPWSSALRPSDSVMGRFTGFVFFTSFSLLFAVSAGVLAKRYAPYAAGSGIPEVKTILGGFIIRKFLGGWTLLIKCIGLVLSTSTPLALGKEGPMVHVACCVGNVFTRLFAKYNLNEVKRREILSAASAAGVSIAFGAPIGGVLFSLEEVSAYFPMKTLWRSFLCAMVAAISLQFMDPFRTGKLVLFQTTYSRPWHAFEMPFFVLLGVAGGLFGAGFVRFNMKLAEIRKRTKLASMGLAEVVAITFLTCVIGYPISYMSVSALELLSNLFRECQEMDFDFAGLCDTSSTTRSVLLLLISWVLKAFLMTVTIGVKIPAGSYVPSMAVGACVGRAVGILVQAMQKAVPDAAIFSSCAKETICVTPGTYAMVGAAASLAGVTRMTVSLAVIMFEVTGALTYLLPIMLSVMTAKWVADMFGKETIVEGMIHMNKYPFLDNKEEYHLQTRIESVMTPVHQLQVINADGEKLSHLEDLILRFDLKGYPVVDSTAASGPLLVGWIGRAELRQALEPARKSGRVHLGTKCTFKPSVNGGGRPSRHRVDDSEDANGDRTYLRRDSSESDEVLNLSSWMDVAPFTVSPRMSMDLVLELFKKMGLTNVIVAKAGILKGLLSKKDLLKHLSSVHGSTGWIQWGDERTLPSLSSLWALLR
ncbi:hypothetical protein M427DRAFT_109590 [Gonapodya prolifera JEL478]|uniref:Chloride channel protein n=1 Tax=Gonapodya prolifera (strain JEL478) TaxID=1344416 RepID=A0A139ANR1_GONPJ|nr:hypothetical protein M427DRAFT_109590 [Gonapodya prolifera JEL478]|eukprot:KXS18389.1 hypothetical protein M427DRAFT_109590 [Gonapodya prolifera JEL478]